jgi:uncharacterized protein
MREAGLVTWVIKSSKLCNLRCSYCYEWNELDKKDRIDLELWRRIFIAVKDFEEIRRSLGRNVRSLLVLHGGEPLILPVSYLRQVMELKNEILGTGRSATQVALQTNAFSVSDEMIEFLKESKIRVGVSHDVAPGVRLSARREPVEARVEANIERLRAAGVHGGGIVVLAGHTAPKICEIYDWYAKRKTPFRVLPLFDGPDARPGGYSVPSDSISEAMCTLFDHWITTGAQVTVEPFTQQLRWVVQKLLGGHSRPHDREYDGDSIFLLNTNGDVYHVPDAYRPERALGNLGSDSLERILAGEAYRASLERDRVTAQHYCEGCEYRGSCRGTPLQQAINTGPHTGRCPIVYNFLHYVEQYLVAGGYGKNELYQLLVSTRNKNEPGAMGAVAH